uniref:Exocyst complex component 5 n=1 Tax=Macrostomum lignano TaxID=282301 RepID=A0A1I8J5B9_9PLAT
SCAITSISWIAESPPCRTRPVTLGDQLESANGPRERLAEMELLVRHLHEFCLESRTSFELTHGSPKLAETAATIQKLYQICSEFPDTDEFLKTKQRIIEFESAFLSKDYNYCHRLSVILASFKAYSRCTERFVTESLKTLPYLDSDVHRELKQCVSRTMESARAIFSKRLKDLVANRFRQVDPNDRTAYLKVLESVHQENRRACDDLAELHLGVDLAKLSHTLFLPYLSGYFQVERENLNERCQMVLDRYYEEQGHVLQQQQVGPHNLLQHIFSGASEEQGAGRVLLCGLSVANIVAEVSQSCSRCRHLSQSSEFFQRAKELADIFFRYIYDEHVTYGLRLAALGLPQTDEVAQRPNLSFLEAVREANMIFHLCESKYSEILAPALKSAPGGASPQLAQVQERRRAISCGLEAQIQQGLERTLAAIVGHVRHLLNSEQKAADFRPPIGGSDAAPASAVALRTPAPRSAPTSAATCGGGWPSWDGKNGQLFRDELGIRLYRCLVEHLHKFKYSLSGGLQALCDLTEYMACLKPVRHSGFLVDGHDLYDVLCKLLNLLVIQPANLHDICEEESLRSLSREVKQSFIMLRTDSGSAEVCAYISGHVVGRLAFLDGKNGQLFRDELGIRLYRCLVEHLHKFKYSLSGGLQALCDLTEYMACLKPVRHSGFLVDGHDLYDVLCKLLNLLVIQPANLHDICEEESLRSLSREVKQSFIMLRTDSGSAEVKAALEKI